MPKVTLQGNPASISGDLPEKGSKAPEFKLTKNDLSEVSLAEYMGSKLILNIFPSVNTGVCAMSVRKFNEEAAKLDNTKVLCISMDLPFAQAQFCGAEDIKNVETLSNFRDDGAFGSHYGVEIKEGPFKALNARSIVVLNEKQEVVHTELVSEIADEPNYEAALKAVS